MSMPPRPLAGDVPGTGDIPGIGAIVATEEGEGLGTCVLTGAGVFIGIPGMGAIVGSAAITGAAHAATSATTRARRGNSNGDLDRALSILRTVVHITQIRGF